MVKGAKQSVEDIYQHDIYFCKMPEIPRIDGVKNFESKTPSISELYSNKKAPTKINL